MMEMNVHGLLPTNRAFIGDLIAAAEDGRRADLVHVGSIGGHTVFPGYASTGPPRRPSPTSRAICGPSSGRAACG